MVFGRFWILFSACWSLLSLLVFILFWEYVTQRKNSRFTIAIPLLILITLLVRAIPQILLPVGAGFDIQSYEIVGNSVLDKTDIYTSEATQRRYPYLPFQMYWSAIAVIISSKFSIPFPIVAKTLAVSGDVLISVFIYLILSRNFDKKIGSIGGLLFALNPIPIFVSAFHGQFDSVPIVLVIISMYYITKPFISGLLFGLSILAKSWPVLFLPSFLRQQCKNRNILTFAISTVLIPLIATFFYTSLFNSSFFSVIKTAISYNHGIGVWGYSYFLRVLNGIYDQNNLYGWFIQNARFITLGVLIVVWLKFASNQSLPRSFFIITLAFLSFTHAFSIQYLSWLIPFAILDNRINKWLFRYTIAAFAYMFMAYNTLILDMNITNIMPWKTADHLIILTGIPVWLVSVGWFFQTIRSRKRYETL